MLFVVEYYTVFLLINYCPIDSERSKTCCSVRGRTACRFHGSLPGGRYVRPWQRRSCPADLPRTPTDGAAGHLPRPGRAARSLPPWPDPDGDGTHSVDGADSKRQIERNFVAKGLVAADMPPPSFMLDKSGYFYTIITLVIADNNRYVASLPLLTPGACYNSAFPI
jgi:hypothetical protein